MPIYDFECQCGRIFESIVPVNCTESECEECGMPAKRIISVAGQYCSNQDARWLKTVLEVVDKDSKKPADVEFRNNPTRENYKRWMKENKIRPVDYSVNGGPPTYTRPPEPDLRKLGDELYRKHRERKRIEI